jgi:hypothetical protein
VKFPHEENSESQPFAPCVHIFTIIYEYNCIKQLYSSISSAALMIQH